MKASAFRSGRSGPHHQNANVVDVRVEDKDATNSLDIAVRLALIGGSVVDVQATRDVGFYRL